MYSRCDYGQECGQIRVRENDMWSGIDQITWSNHVVGAEKRISFLPLQVLYCNLEKRICQVVSQLICCALFATRRSDTTSLTQYTASGMQVLKITFSPPK